MDDPAFSTQDTWPPPGSQMEHQTFRKPRNLKAPSDFQVPVNRDNVATNSMYKTEICRNFQSKGRCKYGDKCIFSHGFEDKSMIPLGWQNSSKEGNMARNSSVMNEITSKRGICKYSREKCPYRNKCIFPHQRSEKSEEKGDMLRESSAISIQTVDVDPTTNASSKTKLCNNWMISNSCSYGAKCIYSHGQAELRKTAPSLTSESGDACIAPGTSNTDALALPNKSGKETAPEQKLLPKGSLFNHKKDKKIVGIYADWIDEE